MIAICLQVPFNIMAKINVAIVMRLRYENNQREWRKVKVDMCMKIIITSNLSSCIICDFIMCEIVFLLLCKSYMCVNILDSNIIPQM